MKNLIVILMLFVFASCQEKEPWKTPTDVKFDLTINPQGSDGGPGDLTFSSGSIIISSITLSGSVQDADNFNFVRTFDEGLKVNFLDNVRIPELTFSLPQGNYNSLNIMLETYQVPTAESNLYVEGTFVYNNPNRDPATVIIEDNVQRTIELKVTDADMNTTFSLNEGSFEEPSIVLNPPFWFKNITASIMNGSNTTIVNGKEIININNGENVNIYTEIEPRIGKDAISMIEQ